MSERKEVVEEIKAFRAKEKCLTDLASVAILCAAFLVGCLFFGA
jgi:hypothetical protein